MNTFFKPAHLMAAVIVAWAFAPGCSSINSTFETSAAIPKGKFEVMGNASTYFFTKDKEGELVSERYNTNIGIRAGYGIAKNVDIKMRYEILIPNDQNDALNSSFHYFSFEPKVSFGKKQSAALKIPVGAYFTKNSDGEADWVVSPQILVTPLRKARFDLTFTTKLDIWVGENSKFFDNLLGFTLGTGFGKQVATAAFRPEIGLLFNPGEDGVVMTFGAAFTKVLGKEKAAR